MATAIIEWLSDKNDYEREQWSCEYCKKRKLVKKRNHDNLYPEEEFKVRVPQLGIITQCPISAIDKAAYNMYNIVRESNIIGMGGGLLRPSLFYSEANIYFESRSIVLEVVGKFEKSREARNKSK